MQTTALAVTEALTEILSVLQCIRQDPVGPLAYGLCGQMLDTLRAADEGTLSEFFPLLCMALGINLEPEKLC